MKVAFFGYRDWAEKIFDAVKKEDGIVQVKDLRDAEVILFYGWSEIILKDIYSKKLCLILHPSPLPKYRGGSPLQHQIINGEKMSAVTICKVTDKLDAGDIYSQTPFSLEGTLDEIFERIVEVGIKDTIDILTQIRRTGYAKSVPQDESQATYFKRRKPEESELTLLDLEMKTAEQLNNFIRALLDPYPNAYIVCADGKKLYLRGSGL